MSVPNNAITDHNIHDDYVKNPPNSRIHDLVGTEGTEVVNDDPPSAEEKQRVQELADRLNK